MEIDMTGFDEFQKTRIQEIDETHKKMSEDPEAKAKIMETLSEFQKDVTQVTPAQVVLVGLVSGLLFVIGLVLVVNLIV